LQWLRRSHIHSRDGRVAEPPRPSSSQRARNDRAKFQDPATDRLVGHVDATLDQHILDVSIAQTEVKTEPNGLLNGDARKAVAAV
jgi:hypothetical protein